MVKKADLNKEGIKRALLKGRATKQSDSLSAAEKFFDHTPAIVLPITEDRLSTKNYC